MTQEEHLDAIERHLTKLLEIAKKRTPGAWANVEDCVRRDHSQAALVVVFGRPAGLSRVQDEQDAAFIAACAGNAEAGWRTALSQIQFLRKISAVNEAASLISETALRIFIQEFPIESLTYA